MRLQRSTDLETVKALNQILFPETLEAAWPGVHWLVYNELHEAVGFQSVYPPDSIPLEERAAYLYRYGLLPSARGQRFSDRMLRAAIRWAEREGYERLITYTWNENIASRRAMLRVGFLPYYPEPTWAGDVLYYERQLPKNRPVSRSAVSRPYFLAAP